MCIHALYVFACGHHAFHSEPLIPCPSRIASNLPPSGTTATATATHPSSHPTNPITPPCRTSAHPYRSLLINAYCSSCSRTQASEDAQRWTRLRGIIGPAFPGLKRFGDVYGELEVRGSGDLGEGDVGVGVGGGTTQNPVSEPLIKPVRIRLEREQRTRFVLDRGVEGPKVG